MGKSEELPEVLVTLLGLDAERGQLSSPENGFRRMKTPLYIDEEEAIRVGGIDSLLISLDDWPAIIEGGNELDRFD